MSGKKSPGGHGIAGTFGSPRVRNRQTLQLSLSAETVNAIKEKAKDRDMNVSEFITGLFNSGAEVHVELGETRAERDNAVEALGEVREERDEAVKLRAAAVSSVKELGSEVAGLREALDQASAVDVHALLQFRNGVEGEIRSRFKDGDGVPQLAERFNLSLDMVQDAIRRGM